MIIHEIIPMTPVSKGRARITKRGFAYTPKKTRDAEDEIRTYLLPASLNINTIWSGVPLKLEVVFYVPQPKSKPKKRDYPITRSDLDNYLKLLLDSITGCLIHDDSVIVTINAKKRYSDTPCIDFTLQEETE